MNSLNASTRALPPTIPQTPARKPPSTELIAVTIKRDVDGSPGFSIQGGIAAEPIRISSITPGGAADQTRKLRVGDRILSVNGQNVKFCRQDQVVTMLTGIETEIYLCVEREIKSAEKAKLTPSRSLPLICQEMSSNAIYELIASAYKRPEATTSSVSKSRSTTHLNFIDEKVIRNFTKYRVSLSLSLSLGLSFCLSLGLGKSLGLGLVLSLGTPCTEWNGWIQRAITVRVHPN
jgi:hypothetical protein